MTRQAVRLTLLTIVLAAIAVAAWLVSSTERQRGANDAAARQFQSSGAAALTAIADLRTSQQSYVAADQGDVFWSARVTALMGEVGDDITALKASAIDSTASAALDDASTELQNFDQVDRRARELAHANQLTAASDLIYSDGFDQSRKAADAVTRAVDAELQARDAGEAALRRRSFVAAGGAAAISALAMVLLAPLRRKTHHSESRKAEPLAPASDSATEASSLDLRLPTQPAAAETRIDVPGVAALCADLARVSDTSALPALLGRASDLLDAAGLVVWIADPDGRELFPTLVHGYPPQIATRLGTLSRDAENVTAAAFRTGLLQIVKATPASNGAVVAPLVAPSGVVGVLAAELRNDGEQQDEQRAGVSIIAAQLSTLVGPPSSRARNEATG